MNYIASIQTGRDAAARLLQMDTQSSSKLLHVLKG